MVNSKVICQLLCSRYSSHLCSGTGESIGQIRFVCQFGVLVFKASLLWYWGLGVIGHSRVICQHSGNWYAGHLSSGTWGFHWLKWGHLPTFV